MYFAPSYPFSFLSITNSTLRLGPTSLAAALLLQLQEWDLSLMAGQSQVSPSHKRKIGSEVGV